MLVNASMRLHALKELLWREVGLEGPSLLELRLRNRPITGDAANDDKTLAELGFASGMQVVVSRVLGARAEDQQGLHEKNKQFVGDLLFGQAPQGAVDPAATGAVPPAAGAAGAAGGTAPAAGAKGAKGRAGKGAGKSGKGAGKGSATTAAEANEEAPAPVSIVDSFRITGGYQILGACGRSGTED